MSQKTEWYIYRNGNGWIQNLSKKNFEHKIKVNRWIKIYNEKLNNINKGYKKTLWNGNWKTKRTF